MRKNCDPWCTGGVVFSGMRLGALALASSALVFAADTGAATSAHTTPDAASPAICIKPTVPLMEGVKTVTLAARPIDLATQWLAVCVGDGHGWTALAVPRASSGEEFEVNASPDGLAPETQLRACVIKKEEDARTACNDNRACQDVPVFPRPRFRGSLSAGRQSFELSLPSGPWRKSATDVSVEVSRAGSKYAASQSLPEPAEAFSIALSTLGVPKGILLVDDSVTVSIVLKEGTVATPAMTVPELLYRSEVTYGRKAVKVFFSQPTEATDLAPIIELSVPYQPPLVVPDDQRKSGQATLSLAHACRELVDVTLQLKDPKTKEAVASYIMRAEEMESRPQITMPLKDGMDAVSGSVASGFTDVEIRLWKSTAEFDERCVSTLDPVSRHVEHLVERNTVATQKSSFSFKFARPLAAGETVEVCPVEEDSSPPQAVNCRCTRGTVQRLGWGSVTATFTIGTLFSQKNTETSGTLDKVSPYLALSISTVWSEVKPLWGPLRSILKGTGCTFQSFFEARLTQAGATDATKEDAAAANLASQRSGLFQTGLFVPIFSDTPDRYVLFAAPLVKGGFQAIAEGYALSYKTATDASGNTSIQVDADGRPVVNERSSIAPFAAAGIRFGLGELSCKTPAGRKASAGHCRPTTLISYLDIVFGHFVNYRDSPDPTSGETTTAQRLVFEGRLAAPDLPLELGFDANLRLKHWDRTPHDYRVFVAVRFDAARALKKVFNLPAE